MERSKNKRTYLSFSEVSGCVSMMRVVSVLTRMMVWVWVVRGSQEGGRVVRVVGHRMVML